MAYVQYIALRNIAPGHVEGNQYDLDILGTLTRQLLVDKEVIKSEDGQTITLFNREELSWGVQTRVFGQSTNIQIEDMREFLASVARGESFSFIPDGEPGGSGDVFTVILEGSNWAEERIGIRSNYRYSLKFRAIT